MNPIFQKKRGENLPYFSTSFLIGSEIVRCLISNNFKCPWINSTKLSLVMTFQSVSFSPPLSESIIQLHDAFIVFLFFNVWFASWIVWFNSFFFFPSNFYFWESNEDIHWYCHHAKLMSIFKKELYLHWPTRFLMFPEILLANRQVLLSRPMRKYNLGPS